MFTRRRPLWRFPRNIDAGLCTLLEHCPDHQTTVARKGHLDLSIFFSNQDIAVDFIWVSVTRDLD